ncbi:MAG: HU family DNA-binding protein [Pseudolabrys sp.]
MASAAKPPVPKSINTRHLAYELAEQHQLANTQAVSILERVIDLITTQLTRGERVKIVGLGILQVRNRAARVGRNPRTGEQIQIKASKKVAFRASKELKEAV